PSDVGSLKLSATAARREVKAKSQKLTANSGERSELMESRTTVTIARRMGSGGSYVGRVIAERLGLRYVDREVLHRAAETLGVEEEALEANRERVSTFWERFLGSLSFGPPE